MIFRSEKPCAAGGRERNQARATPPPQQQQLCSICLGGLAADGEDKAPEARLLRLPCGHLFHYDCGLQWLGAHESCPECRALVSAPEQQQQQPGTPPQLTEGAP